VGLRLRVGPGAPVMPRIGSLFSGIGGLDLGVEAATGGRTVWQVERDPWCRTVLAKHWPDARRFDDVCAVGEELEPVDVICGGFPCQDVSVAGKRKGLAGERSGLWSEYARIVRVVRPRIVFVENVAGLLSMEFGRVLGDLAALGFDAEWAVFRASDAGAPHRRERVFVLAMADSNRNGLVPAEPVATEGREGFTGVQARTPNTGVRSAGRSANLADALRVDGERRGSARVMDDSGASTQGEARQRQRRGDAPRGGGEAVGVGLADADSGRREGQRERGLLNSERAAFGDDVDGRHGAMADADLSRLEGRRVPERGRGEQRAPRARCSGGDDSGCAQPRLGRVADGFPCGLDGHRWPAGRGAAQHEWEAPRVAEGVPQRRHRLKALGNAVVPQQAALAWRVLAARFGGVS